MEGIRSILGATRTGFTRALGAPLLVAGLWLLTVLAALPATVVVGDTLHGSWERNASAERMRQGWDGAWFSDFDGRQTGVAATFDPSITGAGALWRNREAWLTGEWGVVPPVLAGFGVAFALLWCFLLGGVLVRLSGQDRDTAFAAASGRYFARLLRLLLLSLPFYGLVYGLLFFLLGQIDTWTREVTREGTVLWLTFLAYALTGFLLVLVNEVFAYARVATVSEERRSMVFAAAGGLGFVASHPLRCFGLRLVFGVVGLAAVVAFGAIHPGAGAASLPGIAWMIAISQSMVLFTLALRLARIGARFELYRSARA